MSTKTTTTYRPTTYRPNTTTSIPNIITDVSSSNEITTSTPTSTPTLSPISYTPDKYAMINEKIKTTLPKITDSVKKNPIGAIIIASSILSLIVSILSWVAKLFFKKENTKQQKLQAPQQKLQQSPPIKKRLRARDFSNEQGVWIKIGK